MKRPSEPNLNRRQLLRRAAALGSMTAAPYFIPSSVLGAMAPSERITLGFIGIGMMGQGHLRVCLGYPDVQVVATCDVDRWRRDNAKRLAEETYASRTASHAYHGCTAYNDFRELLTRDDVDAVVIATGDNCHGIATVAAAKAGKDIYCEKPISKTIHEARAMADAAARYDRVAQIGLQQRSTYEFVKAARLVRGGRIGKVKMVYVAFPGTCGDVSLPSEPVPEGLDWDLWLGPAPWRPFNARFHRYGNPPHVVPWHFCRDFGGGNLTSNAVHSFDVVQWGLGMDESGPIEVIPPETGEVPSLTYRYANDVKLHVVNWHLEEGKQFIPKGWDPQTRLQNFGALYIGEEGWIHVGRGGFLEGFPDGILDESKSGDEAKSPVANHHRNWFDCIKSRETPHCDIAVGCRSTIVSHLGCIAHWTGRRLRWDPVTESFDDDEANRLRSRAMREPWRV